MDAEQLHPVTVFNGIYSQKVTCPSCDLSILGEVPFTTYPVAAANFGKLSDAFAYSLKHSVQYKCMGCQKPNQCPSEITIIKYPTVLVVLCQRYDNDGIIRPKQVDFEEDITFGVETYKLQGTHQLYKWYMADDNYMYVREDGAIKQETPWLCFYKKVEKNSRRVGELSGETLKKNELQNMTGTGCDLYFEWE